MRVPHVSRDQYMSQHSEAEQSNDRTYKARETSMCVCVCVGLCACGIDKWVED